MLRIGAIDFINALPFYAAFFKGAIDPGVELIRAVPSELNRQLRSGTLDLSPISCSEYLHHRDLYALLPDFCIGARTRVDSVCLYYKGAMQELGDRTIGVTSQSASSSLLVKVLCHHFWQLKPRFETLPSIQDIHDYEAFLLIGDQCLEHPYVKGYQTIDLAQAWFHATGLPFTFAVFAVRKDSLQRSPQEVSAFEEKLRASFEWSSKNPEIILELAQQRCSRPLDHIRRYYNLLYYHFDALQRKALDRFDLLAQAVS